jgi:quercetin dioxygenase-like cupin family protein
MSTRDRHNGKRVRVLAARILLALFAPVVLIAQAPGEVKLDAPEARVVLMTVEPHGSSPPMAHVSNRVLIYLDAGRLTTTPEGGKAETMDVRANDVKWSAAGTPYRVANESDRPVRIVVMELKRTPSGPLPPTPLDPPLVDAKHYRVEFENDYVRVLRIHYGPREGGARHEHILNRVVWYINDHANYKAGEVHVSGKNVHQEDNPLDQDVERIAVEIK